MGPFPFINGTLEKMLTGMRTHTVTNGTSFFFFVCLFVFLERNALWVIFRQGEKLRPPRKTPSPGLWRESDRTRKQRMVEEAKCIVAMQLARRLSRSVCVQGAPSSLSLSPAEPGAAAAGFLSRVEAVKVLKVVRLSCSGAQLLQEQAGWKPIYSMCTRAYVKLPSQEHLTLHFSGKYVCFIMCSPPTSCWCWR